MTRIILLRHGVTDENEAGLIQGQMDGHLTGLGREQARAAGRQLSGRQITRAVSSDLARARDTLLEALEFIDCPWSTDARLRERNFGQFHGRTRDEYAKTVEESQHDPDTFCPPDGEDYAMVHERVVAFLDDTAGTPGDEVVLAVTHGGVVRHLLAHAHQRPLIDTAAFETDNASITELEIANDGTIAVVSMNNTSHLSPEQTGPRLEMI
ncbi:MAG: histidine phosphatase family protein [Lentisphaeria bacterium]|jgi:broad specificity phosphatase PhoE|nr:histidine phosphatase family protein [Lentisphaeria bacterium]MDP7741391.1 histidine phosphatase family protein [Lentisphaeria bacterium]